MKTPSGPILLFLPLLLLAVISPPPWAGVQQAPDSPTPTYDPFAEPPLPEHPTEYELGRSLYWHWCMTCHGDRGQGLTDEFRLLWEPDHQNCWGRGCHGGRLEDQGFPIPTVVPALVDEARLARFGSVQALADFLEATHPPQSPGVLKNEEYRAVALFLFTLNARPLIGLPVTPTPGETPVPIPASRHPVASARPRQIPAVGLVTILTAILLLFILLGRKKRGEI